MFSGIIEAKGCISQIEETGEGVQFAIKTSLPLYEVKLGDSICVDGCCLTVNTISDHAFGVFLSHETLQKTKFSQAKAKQSVHLERSIQVGDRLDGHIVQGHVEYIGKISDQKKVGDSLEVEVDLPSECKPLVIPKGSIAVDGVSLTVNSLEDHALGVRIRLNLIPYTLQETNLGEREIGDFCNIETDIFGRYAQRAADLSRN